MKSQPPAEQSNAKATEPNSWWENPFLFLRVVADCNAKDKIVLKVGTWRVHIGRVWFDRANAICLKEWLTMENELSANVEDIEVKIREKWSFHLSGQFKQYISLS